MRSIEFCTAIHSFVTGEPRDFIFGTLTYHSMSHPADEKYFQKGAWSGSGEPSECFLSGRGQGHVSNFYTVDLQNFAIANRRYTGDIHNSTVVGLFMTHCLQLNLQFYTIGLVRTCRISSVCTVAW